MNHGTQAIAISPEARHSAPKAVEKAHGANNQIAGRASQVSGDLVELTTDMGLRLFARRKGEVAEGAAATAFVRPEVATLARKVDDLPSNQPRFTATVASLLFDGANSAVLVREQHSGTEFHIALPQTGQFADLRVGEDIGFGFDPERALCFPAIPSRVG